MQEERVINETNIERFAAWTTPRVANRIYCRDDILDIKEDYKILEMMLVDLGFLLRRAQGPDSRLWKIACGCAMTIYWMIQERWELELHPLSKSDVEQKNQSRYESMIQQSYRYYDLENPQTYDSYIPEGPVDVWAVLQELFELTDPSDPLLVGFLSCILQSACEIFCQNGENPQWKKPLAYLIMHLQEVLAHRQEYIPVPGDRAQTQARRQKLQQSITAAAEKTVQP